MFSRSGNVKYIETEMVLVLIINRLATTGENISGLKIVIK